LLALIAALRIGRFVLVRIWREIKKADVLTWVFRLLGIPAVLWLVYDRLYETAVTVSSTGSDPQNPFIYPFAITNNSHLFPIQDVSWQCFATKIKLENEASNIANNTMNVTSAEPIVIPPGQTLNIDCNVYGKTSHATRAGGKIVDAELVITLKYTSIILGIFPRVIQPLPTRFTWWGDASNPQWVRGDLQIVR
jgi:hypothetical protein